MWRLTLSRGNSRLGYVHCCRSMRKGFVTVLLVAGLMLPCSAQARQVGGGDIVFKPREPSVKQVIFSHDKHVEGQGIKCVDCHYMIFQMAKGSFKMDMNKITKGDFCGKCHNGQKAFDVKETKNCIRCHK